MKIPVSDNLIFKILVALPFVEELHVNHDVL